MKVYFSKGGAPFAVVMDIVAPDLRNFLKADRTGTRRGLCEAIEKMFKNKGIQARFEDECAKCGHVKTPSATGNSLYCRNPKCEDGRPSQEEINKLFAEMPHHKDELASAYFDRLRAAWKERNDKKGTTTTTKRRAK